MAQMFNDNRIDGTCLLPCSVSAVDSTTDLEPDTTSYSIRVLVYVQDKKDVYFVRHAMLFEYGTFYTYQHGGIS